MAKQPATAGLDRGRFCTNQAHEHVRHNGSGLRTEWPEAEHPEKTGPSEHRRCGTRNRIACRSAISSGAASPSAGARNLACPPTPIRTTTTTSTGSSRCRTWTRGFGRSRRSRKRPRKSWSRPASARSCTSISSFPCRRCAAWETDTFEKLERAEFDDPRDRRRFFRGGRQPDRRRRRRLPAQLAAVDRDRQIAAPGFPGLWQHDRSERVPHAPHRPGERHALDGRIPGAHGRGHQPHRRAITSRWPGPRSKPARVCSTGS